MIRLRVPTALRRLGPLFGSPTTAPLPRKNPPTPRWTIINPNSFASGKSSQLLGRYSHHSDRRYIRLSSSGQVCPAPDGLGSCRRAAPRSPPGAQSWCGALSPTPAGNQPARSACVAPRPAGPPRRRRPSPVPPRSPKPGSVQRDGPAAARRRRPEPAGRPGRRVPAARDEPRGRSITFGKPTANGLS